MIGRRDNAAALREKVSALEGKEADAIAALAEAKEALSAAVMAREDGATGQSVEAAQDKVRRIESELEAHRLALVGHRDRLAAAEEAERVKARADGYATCGKLGAEYVALGEKYVGHVRELARLAVEMDALHRRMHETAPEKPEVVPMTWGQLKGITLQEIDRVTYEETGNLLGWSGLTDSAMHGRATLADRLRDVTAIYMVQEQRRAA